MLISLLIWILAIAPMCIMLTWSEGETAFGAVRGYRVVRMIMATSSLFWPSLLFKYGQFGSLWLQWHFSDLMLPALVASSVVALLDRRLPAKAASLRQQRSRFRRKVGHWRFGLIIGLALSYGFEALSGSLAGTPVGMYLLKIGSFDTADFVCYTIGALAAFAVVELAERIGREEFGRYAALQRARQRRDDRIRRGAYREAQQRYRQLTEHRVRTAVPCQVYDQDGRLVYNYQQDVIVSVNSLN